MKNFIFCAVPLKEYGDNLELTVKQFVIQSSPILLGHMMNGLSKTKH